MTTKLHYKIACVFLASEMPVDNLNSLFVTISGQQNVTSKFTGVIFQLSALGRRQGARAFNPCVIVLIMAVILRASVEFAHLI